ncbi:ABC-2 transporter permease [Paenibacillus sp. KQZ6P-2]|uniref:ABC-2 transporter permease n=1 Tax=Paenibacillus mangrovi TaxID=2931978 RepID=A0A9X1WM88_9BACL|nr:ABC-2 transporter permease [Paenibacillus mangrovi]MCJ8011887.1 ABC-2 transporter permease [Paenibacillus mangrovi]
MDSAIFRNLVRHEFKFKGSYKKSSRSQAAGKWWLAYSLLILLMLTGTATYYAMHNELQINSIWFVTMGFPYMVFFLSYGCMKREWENETYGWWLTMPYPRLELVSAKWLGSYLKVWVGIIAVFFATSAYVLILSMVLPFYTLESVGSFMITGINWLTLVAGLSPIIIALGLLASAVQSSVYRPISPIMWIVFMGGIAMIFQIPDSAISVNMMQQGTGHLKAEWFPYSWELPLFMLLSWILTYALLRLTAYLLEKKLDL